MDFPTGRAWLDTIDVPNLLAFLFRMAGNVEICANKQIMREIATATQYQELADIFKYIVIHINESRNGSNRGRGHDEMCDD